MNAASRNRATGAADAAASAGADIETAAASSSAVCAPQSWPTGWRVERLGMDCAAGLTAAGINTVTIASSTAGDGVAAAGVAEPGAASGALSVVTDPSLLAQMFHYAR